MFRALHNPNHPNYRRSICRHWKRNGGVCERGIYCNFAHGANELRCAACNVKNLVTRGKEPGVHNPERLKNLTSLSGGYVKVEFPPEWEE